MGGEGGRQAAKSLRRGRRLSVPHSPQGLGPSHGLPSTVCVFVTIRVHSVCDQISS